MSDLVTKVWAHIKKGTRFEEINYLLDKHDDEAKCFSRKPDVSKGQSFVRWEVNFKAVLAKSSTVVESSYKTENSDEDAREWCEKCAHERVYW